MASLNTSQLPVTCHWVSPQHYLFQVANGVLLGALTCPAGKHGTLIMHSCFILGKDHHHHYNHRHYHQHHRHHRRRHHHIIIIIVVIIIIIIIIIIIRIFIIISPSYQYLIIISYTRVIVLNIAFKILKKSFNSINTFSIDSFAIFR